VWELLLDIKFWLVLAIAFVVIANGFVSSLILILISGFDFNRLNTLLLTYLRALSSGPSNS
jgi:hypothetical protein